jgi:hypothetical protein
MYPVETVTDFAVITELIFIGAGFVMIMLLTVYFISWGFGMMIKFFKELAR